MIKFDNSSAQFDRMLDEINRPNSLGQRAAIIAGAGAMVLAACGGGDSDRNLAGPTAVASVDVAVPVTTEAEAAPEASFASADTTDDSDAQDDSSDNTSAVDADAAEPVDATDESLRERTTENTNCGGEVNMTSMEDFSYKFDFFSENKELAESLFDVTVNDAKYGMGQEAFDLISEHAYINGNTDAHGLTTGSEDMDALVQLIDSAEQKGDKAFVNGDCRNIENAVSMPSPDLPSITLKDGSSKEGVYLPADKLDELKEVMKNIERFEMMETTIMIDDEEIKVVFITLFANGCDNPIRLKIPVPTPPTVPTTTPEETTTTTTPEETTTTTTPEETTTTTTPEETTTTTTPEETTTTTIPATTTTLPIHPPASGPPPEATQPPYDVEPTPGYDLGNGENVVDSQQGDPTNLDPTPNGTEIPDSQEGGEAPGGGDESVTQTPPASEQDNPDYVDGSASQGTNEGTNNQSGDSDTVATGETAGAGPDNGEPDPNAPIILDPGFPA